MLQKRDDLVNRGYTFRSSIEELTRHFLPLITRCAAQLETERLLLNRFPIQHKLRFHPRCRQQIQAWLVRVSAIEADEKFGVEFREFVLEHHLPHGARTRCRRKAATASNNEPAQTVLHQELGVDLTQEILVGLNDLRYPMLASDDTHPVHGCYLLTRFSHDFFHRLRLHWLSQFYIEPTRLLGQSHRFDDNHSGFMRIARTPLITRLGGRFYIHDRSVNSNISKKRHIVAFSVSIFILPFQIAESH